MKPDNRRIPESGLLLAGIFLTLTALVSGCGGDGNGPFGDLFGSDTVEDQSAEDTVAQDNGNRNDTGNTGEGETGPLVGMTAAHNAVRDTVDIPHVTWDPEVAAFAAEWATELQSRGCDLEHRPRSGEFTQQYGENLAWFGGQVGTAEQVVQMWASEEPDYDYDSNSCSGVCGHYTQIVWRDSQRIGCAMAECSSSAVWVCNYDPPGNFIGQRPY